MVRIITTIYLSFRSISWHSVAWANGATRLKVISGSANPFNLAIMKSNGIEYQLTANNNGLMYGYYDIEGTFHVTWNLPVN